jgi:hypothetical protein
MENYKKNYMKKEQKEDWLAELCRFVPNVMGAAGIDIGGTLATRYDIILESEMAGPRESVYFYMSNRGPENFITEIKLHPGDVFIVGKWGLFILDTTDRSDVCFTEHSFPDKGVFYNDEACKMEAFYNARIYAVINNMIVLNGLPTGEFRTGLTREEKYSRDVDDMRLTDQKMIFMGNKQNIFRLQLPLRVDFGATSRRLRLRLSGLLIQNVTIVT